MRYSGAPSGPETALADAVREPNEEVAGLGSRLEELRVEVGSFTQTRDLISESQTKMSSLESRLSRLDNLVESLSLLVWSLDEEDRQPGALVSLLGPDTSPQRLAAARETLQAALLLKSKPWAVDRNDLRIAALPHLPDLAIWQLARLPLARRYQSVGEAGQDQRQGARVLRHQLRPLGRNAYAFGIRGDPSR